jgi:hypothetical protein
MNPLLSVALGLVLGMYDLDTVMITLPWGVSGDSVCFGLCLILLARNPVSCLFLYNFKTYGLQGKSESDTAAKIYEHFSHNINFF